MMDETIAPTLYRTSGADRAISLVLALVSAASVGVFLWASGPFLWPWGWLAGLLTTVASVAFLWRWHRSSESILWLESEGRLEVRRGRSVPWSDLTKIEVHPSAMVTFLWVGTVRFRVSHRLIRAEELLQRLRDARPDLVEAPRDRLEFRQSSVQAIVQGGLGLGTALAGVLMAPWQPWLGGAFELSATYILFRILFFVPRAYVVVPGSLVVLYWLRTRRWERPLSVREDGYVAGGALFFRMVLDYGRWKVVLDEGQLRGPLRPFAGLIVHLLVGPKVS